MFVLAHIRGGGGELGAAWYEDGKLFNKQNTFNDFIDGGNAGRPKGAATASGCSPWRQRRRPADGGGDQPGRRSCSTARGGASAVRRRGDHHVWWTSRPADHRRNTTSGAANEQAYYGYIKQYSPYDQVKAQAYPHLLVTTGLHDSQRCSIGSRPSGWPKLRAIDDRQLLLYTDMDAGHGGKSGRFKAYEGYCLEYAFILALAE